MKFATQISPLLNFSYWWKYETLSIYKVKMKRGLWKTRRAVGVNWMAIPSKSWCMQRWTPPKLHFTKCSTSNSQVLFSWLGTSFVYCFKLLWKTRLVKNKNLEILFWRFFFTTRFSLKVLIVYPHTKIDIQWKTFKVIVTKFIELI